MFPESESLCIFTSSSSVAVATSLPTRGAIRHAVGALPQASQLAKRFARRKKST